MTRPQLDDARRLIEQIGYQNLICAAEARLEKPDGDRSEMGRLKQALDISGCDDGVEVLEWYQNHRPAQLAALTNPLRSAEPSNVALRETLLESLDECRRTLAGMKTETLGAAYFTGKEGGLILALSLLDGNMGGINIYS